MAHDEDLAGRVRQLIGAQSDVTEKRMFGGVAFLVAGNLAVSASGQGGLLVRCDPAVADALLGEPHTSRFEMRGRAMDGWLRVDPAGVRTRRALERWVVRGTARARALPAKRSAGAPRARRRGARR